MSDSTASTAAAQVRRVSALSSYIALMKPKQTALLLATGAGAYILTAAPSVDWTRLTLGVIALGLSVSGCTVLNMVLDRDIDAMMGRTSNRPLPAGDINVRVATVLGMVISVSGVAVAAMISPLFWAVIGCGFFFDLVIYTMWLKRRTPLSILFGGISGGMPALAGRVLALGRVDAVGLLLAAGVVLWIPSHILTLAMRYEGEYGEAGVPVWPRVYGADITRRTIAAATFLAAVALMLAGVLEGIAPLALGLLGVLGVAICTLAVLGMLRPSEKVNWMLFKSASVYMLGAFLCLVFGAVL
ncbi:MAG: protoheme IX farnesyltransferase [Actinobacteria bacterium HGW-Actinobacteria-6]|jgi:protoheme IX farnesyltransferase|nr:MAG: protoheme IX farnesyltransferase [Actinobacteria bacterium HGW-Actinobacteria-6]